MRITRKFTKAERRILPLITGGPGSGCCLGAW